MTHYDPSGVGEAHRTHIADHDSGAVFRVPGTFLNSREIEPEVVMAQKLFIGGLAFSTSDARLREVFAQAGVVESAAVVMDRETGRSRGFGFVEMASAQEADAAVKKFNGQEIDGRTLKVEIAKPSGLGGARSGGGARNSGFGRSRW
jgi:RNA recognition motif-containing protein